MEREEEATGKKILLHSEKHFQGYWVQLQSKIRRNDDADDLLEGYFENPLTALRRAWDHHHDNPRPAGDDINDLYNTGASVSDLYNYSLCIKTLYTGTSYGDPPGNFPPTIQQLERDPLRHIKEFSLTTSRGSEGGRNYAGRSDQATKAWVRTAYENAIKYKHVNTYGILRSLL